MKVLGIVGGIGAGKTTVVKMIQQLTSCPVIGADEIGHQLLLKEGKAYEKVIQAFGTGILDEQGEIVRRLLGTIVFKDQKALDRLNAITHPLIYEEVKTQINQYAYVDAPPFVVLEAALLIEAGLVPLTDYVIGVDAAIQVRIERIKARDDFTEQQAYDRISKQKKWEELKKIVHYVIDNSESYDQTLVQVKRILIDVKSHGA